MKPMIRGVLLLLLVVCLAAPAAAQAGPRKPAALILKVSGKVLVRRGDKQKPAAARMPLQWDDRLTVPKGASALLLFSNGKKTLVQKDLLVSREAAGMDPAADQPRDAQDYSMGAPTDLDMFGGVSAGTRNFGGDFEDLAPFVRIAAPRNTAVLDAPVFVLEKSDPSAAVILFVLDEYGEEVWATATSAGFVEYPVAAPPLGADSLYTAHVFGALEGRTVRDRAGFRALSRDKAQGVRASAQALDKEYPGPENAFARSMLLVQLYRNNELLTKAADTLKDLLQNEPGDVMAWLELADVYKAMDDARGRDLALLKAAQLAAEQGDPFAF